MKFGTSVYLEKFLDNPGFYKQYECLEIQDFIMPNNLDGDREKILQIYNEQLRDYTGTISIHGPYIDLKPTSFDPKVRELFVERCGQALGAAQRLNAKYMVLHSDYQRDSYDGYDSYFLEQSIQLWKALVPDFQRAGVIAAIENVHNPKGEILKCVLQAINSPYLTVCLDTGHAHALSSTSLDQWVDCFGPGLKYIHIHDNNGLKDEHLPLGAGNIDFESFFSRLKKYKCSPIIISEVFGEVEVQKQSLDLVKQFAGV